MTETTSDVLLERMMQLHPKTIDLALDRMQDLLAKLDHPENHLPPVIHIAGTNGKGSTLAMLRAGFEAVGESVHAYTSPHLVRFHERIRLAGELISEEALIEVLEETLAINGDDPITFFEITNAAAFLAFSRIKADWVLLETGLGGLYDSTNVVDKPALTIITPISMDHESFLGDTIAKIAVAKAGIIKRGVPCVVGPQHEDALDVIESTAARLGAPLLVHGQHWQSWEERGRLIYQDERGLLDLPLPNLPGPHQISNAGAAIAALRHLHHGEEACTGAVTKAEWPARLQRLRRGPVPELAPEAEIWLDGGHNPAAGQMIADFLKGLPKRPTHMVCSMLTTKDARGFLTPLASQIASLTAVPMSHSPNAYTPEELAGFAAQSGHDAHVAPSVEDAVRAIVAKEPHARILIGGSLYLAGEVLEKNG